MITMMVCHVEIPGSILEPVEIFTWLMFMSL